MRSDSIRVPFPEPTGFGGMLAGLDLDKDGAMEIYAVNNNWNDAGDELIPRIYKFEWNGLFWDQVWSAVLDIPKQNTWPPLCWGDWDNDGREEIIWSPVNFTDATNPNPARIIVFEAVPGQDYLGVPDGTGNYKPNAKWTIESTDNYNLRLFKMELYDIDNDGKKELIFCDRASSTTGYRFGVVNVSDIPNNGNGSETWTLKASGKTSTLSSGIIYDYAIIGDVIYLIHNLAAGAITPVKYENGQFTILPVQNGLVPYGSWKSAQSVDIDKDGTKEIVVANWWAGFEKVYLLRRQGDTLVQHIIYDDTTLISSKGRFYGGASGDIDKDGKIDFVFGTRDAVPNAAIVWLKYKGGDITSPNSYQMSIIDKEIRATGGRYDLLAIADVNSDNKNEVIYSNGIDGLVPIVILTHNIVNVKELDRGIPDNFILNQNYPNPFNPSTVIEYGIPNNGNVKLEVYNMLGEKVSTLIDEFQKAGFYQVEFNAKNLNSGTYIFRLQSGNFVKSVKGLLVK